jgi:hypothetical protein
MADRLYEDRWWAVTKYVDGSCEIRKFDEFSELHDRIERGPDWRLIESIVIRPNKHDPIGTDAADAAATDNAALQPQEGA